MSNLIEELREEQVSRLAEKVEALAKEIQAIKNPPKSQRSVPKFQEKHWLFKTWKPIMESELSRGDKWARVLSAWELKLFLFLIFFSHALLYTHHPLWYKCLASLTLGLLFLL